MIFGSALIKPARDYDGLFYGDFHEESEPHLFVYRRSYTIITLTNDARILNLRGYNLMQLYATLLGSYFLNFCYVVGYNK